jgi:hypothetical protein
MCSIYLVGASTLKVHFLLAPFPLKYSMCFPFTYFSGHYVPEIFHPLFTHKLLTHSSTLVDAFIHKLLHLPCWRTFYSRPFPSPLLRAFHPHAFPDSPPLRLFTFFRTVRSLKTFQPLCTNKLSLKNLHCLTLSPINFCIYFVGSLFYLRPFPSHILRTFHPQTFPRTLCPLEAPRPLFTHALFTPISTLVDAYLKGWCLLKNSCAERNREDRHANVSCLPSGAWPSKTLLPGTLTPPNCGETGPSGKGRLPRLPILTTFANCKGPAGFRERSPRRNPKELKKPQRYLKRNPKETLKKKETLIPITPTIPTMYSGCWSRIVFDADSATLIRMFGCWFRTLLRYAAPWRWIDPILSDPELNLLEILWSPYAWRFSPSQFNTLKACRVMQYSCSLQLLQSINFRTATVERRWIYHLLVWLDQIRGISRWNPSISIHLSGIFRVLRVKKATKHLANNIL